MDVLVICQVAWNLSLKRHQLAQTLAKYPATVIAMEACYSSHYWARQFEGMGHEVRLLPAQHVTPFVRGNKSDRNDALAICEAALRPDLRPVPVKTVAQQDIQCLHRFRERYVRNRTGLINQTRGLLSEYGLVAPLGHKAFCRLLREIGAPEHPALSPALKHQFIQIAEEYHQLTARLTEINQALTHIAQSSPLCRLLMSLPGVGVINATALYSALGNGSQFQSGRELAVWLGLTPKQASSGERHRSGGITKRGNRYLRKQLIHGARAALTRCRKGSDPLSQWANALVARRGINKACVAMANRLARLAWGVLQRQQPYCPDYRRA